MIHGGKPYSSSDTSFTKQQRPKGLFTDVPPLALCWEGQLAVQMRTGPWRHFWGEKGPALLENRSSCLAPSGLLATIAVSIWFLREWFWVTGTLLNELDPTPAEPQHSQGQARALLCTCPLSGKVVRATFYKHVLVWNVTRKALIHPWGWKDSTSDFLNW